MNLPRSISVELLSRVGRAIVTLLFLGVFIRELGPSAFGSFVLFEAVIMVGGIGADFGIGSALQKRINEGSSGSSGSTASLLKFVLLLVVGISVIGFQKELNQFIGASLAVYIPLAIGAQQFGRLGLHSLRGKLRVSEAALIQFGGDLMVLLTGYVLVSAGSGLVGLVYGYILGWLVITAFCLIRIKPSPSWPELAAARSLLDFSKYTFISSIIGGALYSWTDTLVIGYFLSPSLVTLYESAWRVAKAVSMVSQSIGIAVFPQVSEWHARERLDEITETVGESMTGAVIVVFPAIIGASMVGKELLKFSFGIGGTVGALVLTVLLIGKIPESTNDIVGRTLYGLNRPDYPAVAASVFIVLNVGLNILLIREFGIIGAAVATSLAFFVNTALNLYFLNTLIQVKPVWMDILTCFIASIWMGIWLFALTRFVEIQSTVSLIGVVIAGGFLYASGLLAAPQMREKLFNIVADVRGKSR